jgi:hypothetical protein
MVDSQGRMVLPGERQEVMNDDPDGPFFDGDSFSGLGYFMLIPFGLATLLLAGLLIYFALGGSW